MYFRKHIIEIYSTQTNVKFNVGRSEQKPMHLPAYIPVGIIMCY